MELKFYLGIGIVLVIVYLEVRLSSRENLWMGLIPIVLVAAFFLSMTAWAYRETDNYHTASVSGELPNGCMAGIDLTIDEKNQVVASSGIEITDESGEVVEVISTDREEYQEIQKRIAPQFTVESSIAELSAIENGVHYGGQTMSRGAYLYFLIIVEVPLILIYGIRRYQYRRKRRLEELREMNIKLL